MKVISSTLPSVQVVMMFGDCFLRTRKDTPIITYRACHSKNSTSGRR